MRMVFADVVMALLDLFDRNARERQARRRATRASRRELQLARAIMSCDPLNQVFDEGRLDPLVAPGRIEPAAQPLGDGRAERGARGALDDLTEARLGARALHGRK